MLVGLKMTNLTTTAQSLKKIAPFLIFGLIVFILIGANIYRLTNKPKATPPSAVNPPEIIQNPSQEQPRSFDFSNIQVPEFPKKLPVYAVISYNVTDAVAKTLATTLGFSGEPTSTNENTHDGREYIWNQSDSILTVSQTSLQYRNTQYLGGPLPTAGGLPLDELQERATSYAKKITVLGQDLEIDPQKTKYWVISENNRVRTDSFENTQMVTFSYRQKLEGLPIVSNDPTASNLTVRIQRDGEVIHLFSRFFDNFSQESSYALKSKEEAIEEIKNGKGRVVLTQIVDERSLTLDPYNNPINTESAFITNISLAYFLPNDIKDTVQPIFVFEGSFKTNKNEDGKVVIYLPAIR